MELSGEKWTCAGGETFDLVALQAYGDEKYAPELLCANPEHCGTMVFEGGEELLLPVVEAAEDEDAAEVMPDKAPWK